MIEQICATKKSGLVDVYGALPCLSLSLERKCFVCFTTQMYLSNSMCKIFLQIFPGDSSCKPTCSRTPPFFFS